MHNGYQYYLLLWMLDSKNRYGRVYQKEKQMPVPEILVDSNGIPMCDKCGGRVAPMREGVPGAGLGYYCWGCGKNWYDDVVDLGHPKRKEYDMKERLPKFELDRDTTSEL